MKHTIRKIKFILYFCLAIFLLDSCTEEREYLEKNNREFKIETKSFKELEDNLLFSKSFSKFKFNKQKNVVSRSTLEDEYNFTIDSSRIKVLTYDDKVSYNFLITKDNPEDGKFENLVIEVRNSDDMKAYLMKYSQATNTLISVNGKPDVTLLDVKNESSEARVLQYCFTTYTAYCMHTSDELCNGQSMSGAHLPTTCCKNPDYYVYVPGKDCVTITIPSFADFPISISDWSYLGGNNNNNNNGNTTNDPENINGTTSTEEVGAVPVTEEESTNPSTIDQYDTDPNAYIVSLNTMTNREEVKSRIIQLKNETTTIAFEQGTEYFVDEENPSSPYYFEDTELDPIGTKFGPVQPNSIIRLHSHHDGLEPVFSAKDLIGMGELFYKKKTLNPTDANDVTAILATNNGIFALRVTNPEKANKFYNAMWLSSATKNEFILNYENEVRYNAYKDCNCLLPSPTLFNQYLVKFLKEQNTGLSLYSATQNADGSLTWTAMP